LSHYWPGNVRELKNCITRSLAFAESDLLLAEHILFDERTGEDEVELPASPEPLWPAAPVPPPHKTPAAVPLNGNGAEAQNQKGQVELNPRQRKAWQVIARNGVITRSEYQAAVGDSISVRTAQYDLRDFVAKGLLKKSGRGPSSRYLIAQSYVI
jgi:DNA-binding NtrC family response regulator